MRIKASIYILLSYILVCGQTVAFAADSAALLPNAKQTFLDNSGRPLSAGKVYFYLPNTTTNKTTWQDATKSVANSNPITLDAAGRATIYGDGSYRQIVKTSAGSLIWDSNTASTGSGGDSGSGDGIAVGTILATSNLTAPSNYLFAYGQEVSRTTYSVLYAAITTSQTVTCASGSPTASGFSDTTQVPVGAVIESTCFAAGTTVLSKTSTTVTFSNNSSLSTTDTIRLFSYGNGNGSTTFNLPDLRGYTVAGRTNMGGTASSNLTSTYFGSNPQATGGIGGSQSKTLLTANLPAYTPAGTVVAAGTISQITPAGTVSTPTITITNGVSLTQAVPGAKWSGGGVEGAQVTVTATSSTPIFTGTPVTPTFTNSGSTFTGTAQGGVSTAFALVQPTLTLNYIIKVLPDSSSGGGGGSGTVTSVTCGTGMTGGTITTSGQCDVTYGTSAATAAVGNDTRITGAAQKASNLSDLASAATARTNLGLATIASSASAADLATGNLLIARFNSGTSASNTTYWRGDGTWSTPAGAGTVTSVDTGTGLTGGPITGSGTILLASITNNTVLGNVSGSTATPTALTTTQLTALINTMVGDSGAGGTKGSVPAPASGDTAAGKYLKADGSWSVPPGSGSSGVTSLGAMTGVIGCGTGITCATATVSLTAPVTLALGGTNNTGLTASNGGVVYSDASKLNVLAGTATAGQIIRSGTSAAPSWSTMVYPNTIAINQIPYANSANNLSAMTAAAGGVVNTSSSSVPTITPTPTLGVAGSSAGKVTLSGSTSGTATIQTAAVAGTSTIFQIPASNGSNGQFLQTNGSGITTWATSPSGILITVTCDTTGAVDCSSDINAALTTCATNKGGKVVVNGGLILVNTGITFPANSGGCELMGTGTYQEFVGTFGTQTPPVNGTIFYQTSTSNSAITVPGAINHVYIHDIAFRQNQPADTGGWTPTVYQPSITLSGNTSGQVNLERIFFYNVYIGVRVGATGSATGRTSMSWMSGACFAICIQGIFSADNGAIDHTHFYSYFLTGTNQIAYMQANAVGIYFNRVDNWVLNDIFTYGFAIGLQTVTSADGEANIIKISNFEADNAIYGLYLGGCTTMSISNFHAQLISSSSSVGIIIPGSGTCTTATGILDITNFRVNFAQAQCLSSNAYDVSLVNARCENWNGGGGGGAAFQMNAGGKLSVTGRVTATAASGSPSVYGTGGTYNTTYTYLN